MVRVCESNIIFMSVHPCVPRPSIWLSDYLLLKYSQNLPKLATPLSLMLRFARATLCVRPCVRRPSICPSRYLLLNHWAEFHQICYITSPCGKGVREQHYFSVRPSSVHCVSRYLLLNHRAEFTQACYITSPHGNGVREQHYNSVRPSSVYLSVTLSPPKSLGGIQPNDTSLPLIVKVCESNIIFPCVHPSGVRPSVRHVIAS